MIVKDPKEKSVEKEWSGDEQLLKEVGCWAWNDGGQRRMEGQVERGINWRKNMKGGEKRRKMWVGVHKHKTVKKMMELALGSKGKE